MAGTHNGISSAAYTTNHVGDNAWLPSGLETPLNGNLPLRNGLALILTENDREATIKIYRPRPELLGQCHLLLQPGGIEGDSPNLVFFSQRTQRLAVVADF